MHGHSRTGTGSNRPVTICSMKMTPSLNHKVLPLVPGSREWKELSVLANFGLSHCRNLCTVELQLKDHLDERPPILENYPFSNVSPHKYFHAMFLVNVENKPGIPPL